MTTESKETKFGVRVCRERKCPDLQRDPKYPDSPQHCAVTHGMPGAMSICVKEMSDEKFILHISGSLNLSSYSAPRPGIKNCPEACPYKLMGTADNGKGKLIKEGHCALTGALLGTYGVCPCNVLGNPRQDDQIKRLQIIVSSRLKNTNPTIGLCAMGICPDGKDRGAPNTEDDRCPIIRLPFDEINIGMGCPLWRIPAKLLPAPALPPAQEPVCTPSPAPKPKKVAVEKPAPEKKRKKKEPEDPICEACRNRNKGHVPDHTCARCKEEQEKKGRRAWTTSLQLGQVHLGDMEDLGEQVPDHAVDMIFTDPPYIDELWEEAYRNLADLAARVLKPYGFLITYAPQAHLDEIIFILNHAGDRWVHGQLNYFWIIQSINKGPHQKAYKWNAICKHKPILVYQLVPDQGKIKGSRKCFSDVVNGYRQKAYHPWQQSVHDVLGIIDRFMVPGEILLDPYAGTGTSLIAANLLGMEWIGFEIDPKTHAIAVRELQQQPIALDAFGVEAEAAECERETAEIPKDTSRQAAFADPAKEARAVELHAACLECEAVARCLRHDPHAGCLREFLDFENAVEESKTGEYVQHCCGTCGHHKGRKTFHESCPRLGELLFKGGDKSAKVLMEETQRENCDTWISKADRIPNITWCSTIRNCLALSWEDGICTKTGKKLTEQNYCPTQHEIGEKPEKKKRASRNSKKGSEIS